VVNAGGTVVWRWEQTEPFGDAAPNDNPSGLGAFDMPLRFPGQYADKETGLFYNYFRDYDPGTGRYPQSDPLGLAAGLNTFSYVDSSPVKFVDPFGLAKCYYSISQRLLICESDDGGRSAQVGPNGVFSGTGECRNDPACANDKNRGPVRPGNYDLIPSSKYGGSWWLREGFFGRQMCKLGIGRCEFFLHEGTISLGCITIDRTNEDARKQFGDIKSMLRGDATNTLQVRP
jgi:RHS repeat-associated protein